VRGEPEHTHYRRESASPTGKVLAGIKSSDQAVSKAATKKSQELQKKFLTNRPGSAIIIPEGKRRENTK